MKTESKLEKKLCVHIYKGSYVSCNFIFITSIKQLDRYTY